MQNIHGIKVAGSKTLKKCQRCDHLTDDSGSLRKHEKICLKNENLNECGFESCGKKFGTETSLSIHARRNHNINRKIFACKRCDFTSVNSDHQKRHWEKCSQAESLITCKHCGYRNYSEVSVSRHVRKKHGFSCNDCNFASTSKLEFHKHRRTHSYSVKRNHPGLIKCKNCDYTSQTMQRLKRHSDSCSQLDISQFVTCKHCGFKSSEQAVYHHIIKNHGLSCNDCPFETKYIEELRRHRRTHPRTLQFKKCTIEGCEFKGSQYLLTKHLETVHGVIKPNQPENLQKCQRCDHISTKESIRKHWKTCSKTEELFECGTSLCEKKFGSEISLSLHRKRTHPEFHLNKCQR